MQRINLLIRPFLLLFFALTACGSQEDQKLILEEEMEFPEEEIKEFLSKENSSIWQVKDVNRFQNQSSDDAAAYAEEVSKFLLLYYAADSLQIGECKLNTYTFKQKTDAFRKDEESNFISFYKPEAEESPFITIMGETKESCFPFDDLLFYHPSTQDLIFLDRGYFFELAPVAKVSLPEYVTKIEGIPGNNRANWIVEFTIINIQDYKSAFEFFKKEFPYGGKNLDSEWDFISSKNDRENLITYDMMPDGILIHKADPMGEIKIYLQLKGNLLYGKYQFELLDEEG